MQMEQTQIMDPFCGSGTIVIEAASILQHAPPGRLRPSPLTASKLLAHPQDSWNDFVTLCLHHHQQMQQKQLHHDPFPRIVAMGSDRDQGVVETACNNAQRAGIMNSVLFQHGAISTNPWFHKTHPKHPLQITMPHGDPRNNILVITNPPFGKRISTTTHFVDSTSNRHPLLPLYQTLGKLLSLNQYPVCILAHDVILARRTGIPNLKILFTTQHGGLTVSALSNIQRGS
jgi:23S rRNA G2445 N2-methylase RlmL